MGLVHSKLGKPFSRQPRTRNNQLPSPSNSPGSNPPPVSSLSEATGNSGHQTCAPSPAARPLPKSNTNGSDSGTTHAPYNRTGSQSAERGGIPRDEDVPQARSLHPEADISMATNGCEAHSPPTESVSISQDPTISVLKDLISLNHAPTPATEQLVGLHQALGQAAIKMTRNKHRMYSILARSREICNYIHAAFESLDDSDGREFQPETILQVMDKSYTQIDVLEEILLEVARLMPDELKVLGPTSLSSWPQSRTALIKIWGHLGGAPFDAIQFRPLVSFTESSYFDDSAWFSRLLYEVIEPEIARQFPVQEETPPHVISVIEGFMALENAVKSLSLTETLRSIVIDMTCVLSITLWETVSHAEEGIKTPNGETLRSRGEDCDRLLRALSGILSDLNRDYLSASIEGSGAIGRWLDVRSRATFAVSLPPPIPHDVEGSIEEPDASIKGTSHPPQSLPPRRQRKPLKKVSGFLNRLRVKVSGSFSLRTSASGKSSRGLNPESPQPMDPNREPPHSPEGSVFRGPRLLPIHELVEGLVLPNGKRSEALDALDCTDRLSERTKPTFYGGSSEVSQAKLGDRVVAVKELRTTKTEVLDESRMRGRLAREIYVWATLDHPNILELLGFAFENGRPCLVSPWCGNGTMQEYLHKYPDVDRRQLVRQISEGLEYLHAQNAPIIHGDFTTANVLVTDDHIAKIGDFGGARRDEEARTGLTTAGLDLPNIRYTAPEIFQGSSTPSVMSDVYSFACVALETMTGKSPFWRTEKDIAVIPKVLYERLTPSPEDHPGLEDAAMWDLLRRCWNHEPSDRPTMTDIRKMLAGAEYGPSTGLDVPEGTAQAGIV